MSQVTRCEQTLLHGLSCLEEWNVEPRHGEQPVFPLQSLAVVWGGDEKSSLLPSYCNWHLWDQNAPAKML